MQKAENHLLDKCNEKEKSKKNNIPPKLDAEPKPGFVYVIKHKSKDKKT